MGLLRKVVPIIFSQGVMDKFDPKAMLLGFFTRLENFVFRKEFRLTKRFGQKPLPTAIAGGGNISSSQGLSVYLSELLQFSNNKVYSFAENVSQWFNKGDVAIINSQTEVALRNTEQQSSPDSSVAVNTVVTAYEDTRGGVRVKTVDLDSGAVLLADVSAHATAVRPKVVSAGVFSFVFYVDGTNLRVRRYDRNQPSVLGSEVAIASDVNASGFYDVTPFNNVMIVVWHTGGNQMKIGYVSTDPFLGSPVTGYPSVATIAESVTGCLGIWGQETSRIYIAYYDSTNGTRITARKAVDLTQDLAPVNVLAAGTAVRNACGISVSATSSHFYLEATGAPASNNRVLFGTITSGGSLSGPSTIRRSVGLASKPAYTLSRSHVNVSHDSTFQSTYFLIRDDGFIESKTFYGNGGGQTARAGHLPEFLLVSGSTYITSQTVKNKIVTEANINYTRTGVALTRHTFSPSTRPQTFPLGENLHLLGGIMQSYDGVSFTETNFHVFPEGPAVSATPTTGGNMSNGTYRYYFIYEWTDARGQIHRSSPSAPLEVTLSGGTATQRVTFNLPTLRMTAKMGSRTAPLIAAFRTKASGQIPFRVSSQVTAGGDNGLVFSDPAVDTVSFTDGLADASIGAREILYIVGGTLGNEPPGPCTAGAVYKNRLVVNSTDGSGLSFYSKEPVKGEGLSFNQYLLINADPEAAAIGSYGVIDDKLLIGKDFNWYVVVGEPANEAGQDSTFNVPEKLASSTGCNQPDSIVSGDKGLYYKSAKGIYLLDRSLKENYIGGAVEDSNSEIVGGAVLMTEVDEIRFVTQGGPALIFNSFFERWSRFTNYKAVDCAVWRGDFVRAASDGVVWREDPTVFTDNGSHVPGLLETGWLSLAQLQGFHRVWRLLVLGEYKSSHKLRIRVGKDFRSEWNEVGYYDPATAINTTTYGSSSPYGSESPYGGTKDSVYQARMHLATQKVQAIRFEIQDVPTALAPGESMTLTGFSLECGFKEGAFKASTDKSMGSL